MFKITKYTILLFFLLGSVLFIGGAGLPVSTNKSIEHKVVIQHPGELNKADLLLTLKEIKNQSGFTVGYSMKVPSVYCSEAVCKVDTVELVWDNIGRYKSFKLEAGVELEKSKGESFNKSDYERLHKILSDPFSALKDLRLKPVTDEAHDVDAVVGATTLDENSTVKGALWTSYTLWHFVNGNAVNIMKEISGKSIDNVHLQSFLKDSTEYYQLFALDVLTQRRDYSEITVRNVIEQTKVAKINIRNTLNYFENSTSEIYLQSISDLFSSSNSSQRVQCLNSLNKSSFDISETYILKLIEMSVESQSYQEINGLLTVCENRKYNSERLNSTLLPILEANNKLIGRRVYWYLSNQKLKDDEVIKLQKFRTKNEDMF